MENMIFDIFNVKIEFYNGIDKKDKNVVYFIPEEYIELYPIFKNAFKSNKEMYLNYIKHGLKEYRLPNKEIFNLMKENNNKIMMKELSEFIIVDNIIKNNNFIILTRTHNREYRFSLTYSSIKNQKNVNIIHYVSFDNIKTKNYLENYENIIKIDLINKQLHPNEYIDKFYEEIIKNKNNGWVIVLDDDDLFTSDYVLSTLCQCQCQSKYMNDENKIIVWKYNRNDRFIYPKDCNKPQLGEIASCAYMYNVNKLKIGYWKGDGNGDYNFFKYLLSTTKKENIIWLPYTLTKVSYENEISGWSAM